MREVSSRISTHNRDYCPTVVRIKKANIITVMVTMMDIIDIWLKDKWLCSNQMEHVQTSRWSICMYEGFIYVCMSTEHDSIRNSNVLLRIFFSSGYP